jgi:hypothetical protein
MGLPGRVTNDPSNYFALGVQGAKDQEAGTFYFFKHLNGSGFDTTQEVSREREGGGGKEIALGYKTMVKPDGQVVAYARPDAAGRLLTYALGADTPSFIATVAAGVFLVNHLIQSGVNASLPYLTADQAWADMVERSTNNIVTDLSIEGEAGRPLKLTAQFISGGSVHVATVALTPARETSAPLMYPGASVSLAVTGGADAGATSIEMTKFKIDIKNGVDDTIQTTGLNREDVIWETADYTLDGTLKYTDKAIWSEVYYGGGVGSQVQVGIATASFNFYTLLGQGASNSLQMNMPLLQVSALKVNRLDPDGKTMFLDFTAGTIKGASPSLFANVVTGATASYTGTAT